jgi:hypothetical protein
MRSARGATQGQPSRPIVIERDGAQVPIMVLVVGIHVITRIAMSSTSVAQ